MDIPSHLFVDFFHRAHDPMQILRGNEFGAFNAATARVLGYDNPEDIKTANPAEFSPEFQRDGTSSREKAAQMLEIAYERGSHVFDWDHVDTQGLVFVVEVALTYVNEDSERNFYSVWRDVTLRLQQQKELIDEERQAQNLARLRSLGELSSEIAHDFRNYIQVMVGYADVIEALTNDQTIINNLEKIFSAGESASDLANRILEYGRQETGELEEIELVELLKKLRDMASPLVGENIRLEFEMPTEPCSVFGRKIQLEEVLLNLVVNGRDAMPNGGELRVVLSVENNQDYEIKISDSGIGMSAELLEQVTQPYFTTKGRGKGSGLGLSMVEATVAAMSGAIDIDSVLDVGTTVTLKLPRI